MPFNCKNDSVGISPFCMGVVSVCWLSPISVISDVSLLHSFSSWYDFTSLERLGVPKVEPS